MGHEKTEFAEFFQASWEPCLMAVAASTGSVQLAEDQVAEAFARAWLSWRKVRRHPAPRAWAVRTALNTGMSWWRKRMRELPLAGHDAAGPRDADDGLHAAVLTALRHLPDRQREVIALRVFLDLGIDTIAGHLGIAPATVRVHLSRAVATLRHELIPFSSHRGRLMNNDEELDDGAVLSAVRGSVSWVAWPTAPDLEAITARGRARRRRLGGLSVAGAGACAALIVGLVGSGSAGPAPPHQAPAVHLAAFSVVAGADGATTLTLYPGQVIAPGVFRQALAEHGIPALVTAGKFCYGDPAVAAEAGQVYGRAPTVVPQRTKVPPTGPSWPSETIVIHGSAIPRGAELSIGYRQGRQDDTQTPEISFTLVRAGAPLTCTSIPGSDGPQQHSR